MDNSGGDRQKSPSFINYPNYFRKKRVYSAKKLIFVHHFKPLGDEYKELFAYGSYSNSSSDRL